jgi:hypothetical protein
LEYNVNLVLREFPNGWFPFHTEDLNLSEEEIKNHYLLCDMDCKTLNNGRVYPCSIAKMAYESGISTPATGEYIDLNTIDIDNKFDKFKFLYTVTNGKDRYLEYCNKCRGWDIPSEERLEPGIQI